LFSHFIGGESRRFFYAQKYNNIFSKKNKKILEKTLDNIKNL